MDHATCCAGSSAAISCVVVVLQSDDPCYDPLHSYFLDRLEPVCTRLLDAAADSGEIHPDQNAYELMRGVGGRCAGGGGDSRYDARRLVEPLVAGLRRAH